LVFPLANRTATMVRSLPVAVLLAVTVRSAAYVGDNLGYGGKSTCVPGYDTDCTESYVNPAPAPAPIINILGPAPAPSPIDEVFSTGAPSCKLEIPSECQFPFTYKGLEYTTCTGVDAVKTMWCSVERKYEGHWRQCKDPCHNKWPVKLIASTAIAGTVAAAGLGLIAAAVHKGAQSQTVTAAPAGSATTAAAFMLKEPVSLVPGGVAVGVMETVVSEPARRMNGLGRQLQGTTAGPIMVEVDVPVGVLAGSYKPTMGPAEANQHLVWLMVGIGLVICCVGCLCSIAVAHAAGFGKKKKRAVDPSDNQAGYPQAYDAE